MRDLSEYGNLIRLDSDICQLPLKGRFAGQTGIERQACLHHITRLLSRFIHLNLKNILVFIIVLRPLLLFNEFIVSLKIELDFHSKY